MRAIVLLAFSFLLQTAWAKEAIVFSESAASFDRRQFVLHELAIDLGTADLSLSASASADAADADTPSAIIPLGSGPLSPLVHRGRWVFLPEGLYSAAGFHAGHQPVFATSWLAEEPPVLVSPEVALQDKSALPILSINRDAGAEGVSMWTADLGRPITPAPDAFSALLTRQSKVFSPESLYLVYKTQLPPEPVAMKEKEVLLTAPGDMQAHFSAGLRHGARVSIRHLTSSEWSGVGEAIPLGMPLVWKGRPVEQAQLCAEASQQWDLEASSQPVLAWFAQENRMLVLWSSTALQSTQTVSRKSLQKHLLEIGAQYAFELPSSATPIQTERVEGARLARLSDFPGARLTVSLTKNTGVNLARLPQTQAVAGPNVRHGGACIDGRWSEESYPSSIWESVGLDEQNRPVRQWVEIDLQQAQTVSRIEILHAESAGFSGEFNTSDFRVLGKAQPSEDFDRLAEVKDNRERRTSIRLEKPEALRYIRLEILRPNHIPGNMTARIAEIEVWR